jgi:hypothetical protein
MEMFKYYDPKLSQAGIMDLIMTLEAQIKDEFVNEPRLVARMPHAQSDALEQLQKMCRHYIDVVEGRA